ncbi:MAG TPA: hypothetical protein VHF26_21860, partial [Trebonia sp.]|nr:hypothetical protein [Trebonia sp.]
MEVNAERAEHRVQPDALPGSATANFLECVRETGVIDSRQQFQQQGNGLPARDAQVVFGDDLMVSGIAALCLGMRAFSEFI